MLNDCRLQAGITNWEMAGREDERLEEELMTIAQREGWTMEKQTIANN